MQYREMEDLYEVWCEFYNKMNEKDLIDEFLVLKQSSLDDETMVLPSRLEIVCALAEHEAENEYYNPRDYEPEPRYDES